MMQNSSAPCVLVYGMDTLLLSTCARVIQTAGFYTCAANSESELKEQ
jgi:hypothetical protein